MDEVEEDKEDIWRKLKMDMELETPRSLSPRAISSLTGIVNFRETHADAAMDSRKRIPTEKGRQFEVQRLKENRKLLLLT